MKLSCYFLKPSRHLVKLLRYNIIVSPIFFFLGWRHLFASVFLFPTTSHWQVSPAFSLLWLTTPASTLMTVTPAPTLPSHPQCSSHSVTFILCQVVLHLLMQDCPAYLPPASDLSLHWLSQNSDLLLLFLESCLPVSNPVSLQPSPGPPVLVKQPAFCPRPHSLILPP